MTSLLGLVAVGDLFDGEARLQEGPIEHVEFCVLFADRNVHQSAIDVGATRELIEERSEFFSLVVHHDHAPVLEALADLAGDVVVKRVHMICCVAQAALDFRLRLAPDAGSGASGRLFSAALTAVEVRSLMSLAIDFSGFSCGLPFAVLILKPKDIFQSVGDGETAVLGTFGNYALGPKMHGEMGPIIVATAQRGPS